MTSNILQSIHAPVKLQEASSEVVKAVQTELVRLNYYLTVDGVPGPKTIAAFHSFKTDNYLGDLDTLGATTVAKLLDTEPHLLVTEQEAETIFGRNITLQQLADLNNCLHRFDICTPARIRHFISQVAHESGGLQWMCEIASGKEYEGRLDLGNTQPGWGMLYKGAGPIEVTGRKNYEALSKFLKDKRVLDEGCAYVATHLGFTASGFWWEPLNHLNLLCDRGATVEQITRVVNGGYKGLQERKRYYAIACKVIQ